MTIFNKSLIVNHSKQFCNGITDGDIIKMKFLESKCSSVSTHRTMLNWENS